jgi:hypothetical protein
VSLTPFISLSSEMTIVSLLPTISVANVSNLYSDRDVLCAFSVPAVSVKRDLSCDLQIETLLPTIDVLSVYDRVLASYLDVISLMSSPSVFVSRSLVGAIDTLSEMSVPATAITRNLSSDIEILSVCGSSSQSDSAIGLLSMSATMMKPSMSATLSSHA